MLHNRKEMPLNGDLSFQILDFQLFGSLEKLVGFHQRAASSASLADVPHTWLFTISFFSAVISFSVDFSCWIFTMHCEPHMRHTLSSTDCGIHWRLVSLISRGAMTSDYKAIDGLKDCASFGFDLGRRHLKRTWCVDWRTKLKHKENLIFVDLFHLWLDYEEN